MFAAYAAWSAREIELQALVTLAALAQISTPSAAHFLKSHQLLVQKVCGGSRSAKILIRDGVEDEHSWSQAPVQVGAGVGITPGRVKRWLARSMPGAAAGGDLVSAFR
jgi:hypothetical protein